MGLVTAGATVLFIGMAMVTFPTSAAITAAGMQVAAAGVFAFNIFPVVVAPFFGIEMEPIEWSNS